MSDPANKDILSKSEYERELRRELAELQSKEDEQYANLRPGKEGFEDRYRDLNSLRQSIGAKKDRLIHLNEKRPYMPELDNREVINKYLNI